MQLDQPLARRTHHISGSEWTIGRHRSPEWQQLLNDLISTACRLLNTEHGSLGLVDQTSPQPMMRIAAVYGQPNEVVGTIVAAGVGLIGQLLLRPEPVRRSSDGRHQAGMLAVPIIDNGVLVGALSMADLPPRQFDDDEINQLVLFAQHAAVALIGADNFERARHRAERLLLVARIGSLITAQHRLDEILQQAADAVHERLGYPNVAVAQINPDTPRVLLLRTISGHYRSYVQGEHQIPIEQGIMGAAARLQRAVLVNDVSSDPRYLPTPGATGIIAELAVPIIHAARLLGVLNVESDETLDDDDAVTLQIVADQLAVAIHNAHLFDRSQRLLDQTRLLATSSLRIATALDLDALLATYLEEVAARGRHICTIVLYSFGPNGERGPVNIWGRWSPADGLRVLREQRAPRQRDGLDPSLDAGQTVTISDVARDERVSEELRALQTALGRPALAMSPSSPEVFALAWLCSRRHRSMNGRRLSCTVTR